MPRKKTTMSSFVSKADTKEMRDYQVLASKYPPLPKEELIAVSRRFVKGRRASVTLIENAALDDILEGNWEEGERALGKDEVIEAFRSRMEEEYREGSMPKDIHDVIAKDIIEMEDSYDLFMETRHLDRATDRRLRMEAEDGDEALAKIVNHNLQFAMACVGKMMRRNRRAKLIGAKELIAVANVGLVLGARQYDPESNKAFTTYAAFHINGQLYEYLSREDGNIGIRVATLHEQKQIISIRQISEAFKARYGRLPNVAEISSLAHISKDRVISRMEMPTVKTQSIFSRGRDEEGDEQEVFLPDLVSNEDNGVESEWSNRRKAVAMNISMDAISDLPWPQDEIIRLHIGVSDDEDQDVRPLTTKQIAKELGLTVHSVERELHDALRTLRTSLSDEGIDDYALFGMGGYDLDPRDDAPASRRPRRNTAPKSKEPIATDEDDPLSGGWVTPNDEEIDRIISDEVPGMGAGDGTAFLDGSHMTMDEAARLLDTLSVLDDDGYDMLGYDAEGYNRLGYDRRGTTRDGTGSVTDITAEHGDAGAYAFVKMLFDHGQRTLPGMLEGMRLAGIKAPSLERGNDGELTITGGGIRITKTKTGVVTFRKWLEDKA